MRACLRFALIFIRVRRMQNLTLVCESIHAAIIERVYVVSAYVQTVDEICARVCVRVVFSLHTLGVRISC